MSMSYVSAGLGLDTGTLDRTSPMVNSLPGTWEVVHINLGIYILKVVLGQAVNLMV